jgi:two-component system sensor histidine kinase HydH
VFRVERARLFWYTIPAVGLAGLLSLFVLYEVTRQPVPARDVALLAISIAATAVAAFMVYRAYAHAQQRLAYVKLYARDVLENLPIGVITADLDGRTTYLNERARALLGIAGDSGRPYREVLGHVPGLCEALDRLVRERMEFGGVDLEYSRDGTTVALRLDGRFLVSASGERIGAILQLQDVTRLKLLDQEMRRTERLAGLGTLAAGIAHEIKNPLAALSINAQLLEENIEKAANGAAAKTDRYMGVIRGEVRRLEGVVDKYISFARPRAIEKGPASLEGILDSVLALVEPECRKHDIRIVRDGFGASPARYLLDEGQLQQAVLNIVINAIQAMERGGTLACRLDRNGAYATVAISDTGPGIAPDVRDRMFDLFYTTKQGGTGIGLYLTQRIVAEHKGFIDVRTGPSGTTLIVGIPAEEAHA